MPAGRRPKPTQLKIVTGNPGGRPLPAGEPQPDPLPISEMPEWLSEAAQQVWPSVAKMLYDAQVLTRMDQVALGMYCETFARWKQANADVVKYGSIVKAPSGFPVQSPYLAIANEAYRQMTKMLVEFGMTPASRTKVAKVPGRKPADAPRGNSLSEFKRAG